MKPLIKFLTILFFFISFASCNSEEATVATENVVFKAYLNGDNIVPANNSVGMGIATLIFNPNTNGFSIIVQYSGLSATSATIYNNQGVTATDLVASFSGLVSETIYYGSINSAQKDDLFANNFILNLHSSNFPDGEICGHLIKQNNDGFPPPPPGKM
ncbi:MAG: CHRD domain-containing protein [Flavobacterium sp.]